MRLWLEQNREYFLTKVFFILGGIVGMLIYRTTESEDETKMEIKTTEFASDLIVPTGYYPSTPFTVCWENFNQNFKEIQLCLCRNENLL